MSALLALVMLLLCLPFSLVAPAAGEEAPSAPEELEALKDYRHASVQTKDNTVRLTVNVHTYYDKEKTYTVSTQGVEGTPVIFYVMNTNTKRLGTKTDAELVSSFLTRGYFVLVLDYFTNLLPTSYAAEEAGNTYTVTFYLKSSKTGRFKIALTSDGNGAYAWLGTLDQPQIFTVDTADVWQKYAYTYIVTDAQLAAASPAVYLAIHPFEMGQSNTSEAVSGKNVLISEDAVDMYFDDMTVRRTATSLTETNLSISTAVGVCENGNSDALSVVAAPSVANADDNGHLIDTACLNLGATPAFVFYLKEGVEKEVAESFCFTTSVSGASLDRVVGYDEESERYFIEVTAYAYGMKDALNFTYKDENGTTQNGSYNLAAYYVSPVASEETKTLVRALAQYADSAKAYRESVIGKK